MSAKKYQKIIETANEAQLREMHKSDKAPFALRFALILEFDGKPNDTSIEARRARLIRSLTPSRP